MKTVKQLAPLLAAIVVLLAVFRLWVPQFLSLDNLLDLAQQISINAVLAFGMTLVILIGGIDLSVGAVVALIGTITVWLLPRVGLGGAVAAGLAGRNDLRRGQRHLRGTDGDAAVHHHAGHDAHRPRAWPCGSTRAGPLPCRTARKRFLALGNARVLGIVPVPVLVMVAVFALTAMLLHRTRFGQHLYAIGGNREAARYTGIPIARNVIAVYVACSLLAGIAGMIHASQLYSAEPVRARTSSSSPSPRWSWAEPASPAASGPCPELSWERSSSAFWTRDSTRRVSIFRSSTSFRGRRHPLRRLHRRSAPEPETMSRTAASPEGTTPWN